MNAQNIGLMVMIGLCVAAALASAFFFFRDRARGQAAASWPTTQAVITRSEMIEWVTSKGGPRGSAEIHYSYLAGGREHIGKRISYGDHPSMRPHARAMVKRYPLGSRHIARYDPENPEDAVLELAPTGTGLLYMAGTFLVTALFLAYVLSL